MLAKEVELTSLKIFRCCLAPSWFHSFRGEKVRLKMRQQPACCAVLIILGGTGIFDRSLFFLSSLKLIDTPFVLPRPL